VMAYTTAA